MVVKLNDTVEQTMELEEYREFVDENVDFLDYDSVCETSWALKALANNRSFLAREVNKQVVSYLNGREFKGHTANSINFHNCREYGIRANVWLPLSQDPVRRQHEATFFGYSGYHDHNFHLVTAGYFGPGYDSDLYEYQRAGMSGDVGAPVQLDPKGKIRLGTGDVITYKAFSDIHAQEPPSEVSVSLNLRVHPPELVDQRLFFFDVEEHTVLTPVCNGEERFASYLRMARHLSDDNTIEPLMALARRSTAVAVREVAREQLHLLLPHDSAYLARSLS